MTDAVKNKDAKSVLITVVRYILLALTAFFVFAPFYIMFATSIMSPYEAQGASFKFWPEEPSLMMYKKVLIEESNGYSIVLGFLNTMLYYGPSSLVGVFVSAMSAFAFAKMKFPGRTVMFSVLIATMTIPNNLGLLTSYLIFDKLHWIGTPLPVMIPRLFGTISVVFFLRQYYMGIPDDLIGCAKLDGAGWFGMFMRIMVPISIPVMAAQFILYFITGYNDYMGPMLYLPNAELATLQLVLAQYEDPYMQNWPLRMAGCLVAMVPMIVLYLASQKFLLKDLQISAGLKG
ncbi:MAG: carbohydrate ABC transporter permease [Christensenellaceae bacterium]